MGTFVSASGFAIIGYSFDFTGSYTLSFIISTGTVIVFFFASFILYRIIRRDQDGDDGTETVPVKPVRRMEAEPA